MDNFKGSWDPYWIVEVKEVLAEHSKTLEKLETQMNDSGALVAEIHTYIQQILEPVKQTKSTAEMLTAIVNNFIDEDQIRLKREFEATRLQMAQLSAPISVKVDQTAENLKKTQQNLAELTSQLGSATRELQTRLELVGQILDRQSDILGQVKSDTSDSETRLSDIRNRIQTVATECETIIDILRRWPKEPEN